MRINEVFEHADCDHRRLQIFLALRKILENRRVIGINNDVVALFDFKEYIERKLDIPREVMDAILSLPVVCEQLADARALAASGTRKSLKSLKTRGCSSYCAFLTTLALRVLLVLSAGLLIWVCHRDVGAKTMSTPQFVKAKKIVASAIEMAVERFGSDCAKTCVAECRSAQRS